jgi:hypothetical protein
LLVCFDVLKLAAGDGFDTDPEWTGGSAKARVLVWTFLSFHSFLTLFAVSLKVAEICLRIF